ncbi:MAG: ATP-binding cassette domain-containing protein [Cutibacterium avidum]|nr:ATP-binding cassette domain-containing protein [Cutibacterium avidum]
MGESGSGKSTIAGTLTGLVPVTSGSVRVAGVEVAGASRRAMLPVRRNTGVVYQNPASALNPRRTVGASIAEPLMLHSPSTRRGGAPGCVNSSSRSSCRNRWLIGTHIK